MIIHLCKILIMLFPPPPPPVRNPSHVYNILFSLFKISLFKSSFLYLIGEVSHYRNERTKLHCIFIVNFFRPENFDMVVLLHHLQVMEEIIARDKNKPSIVMWSVANAPNVYLDAAVPYFK